MYNNLYRPIFFILVLIFSCGCLKNKEFVYEFRDIKNALWSKEDTVRFDVPVTDTVSRFDVFIELRNNNNYPYKNIYLFVSFTKPDGQNRKDTLECRLADDFGKWYGKGSLSLYETDFPYEHAIQFPQKGLYSYSIQHGMRKGTLEGINNVGIKIVKIVPGE